jgi:hypothetical protein
LDHWSLPDIAISATFLDRRHLPQRIRAFLDEIAGAVHSRAMLE